MPAELCPPVAPVFYAFRVMVAAGMVTLLLGGYGGWLRWRRRLEVSPRYLRLLTACWPLGFLATVSGWVVAEVGRQPWTITGWLRTAQAVSPGLNGAASRDWLCLLISSYVLMLAGYAYLLSRLLASPAEPAHVSQRRTRDRAWISSMRARWQPQAATFTGAHEIPDLIGDSATE